MCHAHTPAVGKAPPGAPFRGGTRIENAGRVRAFPFSIAALVATTALSGEAFAEGALRLAWSAPEGCPSAEEVRLRALRGGVGGESEAGVLEADARVERLVEPSADGGWRVTLRTRRGEGEAEGERIIEAATCDGVAEATAVVLSLALVSAGAAPSPEPGPPVVEEPSSPPPKRVEPASERPRATPPALAFGVLAALDTVALPSPAVGGALTLAWTPGPARLELEASGFGAQSKSVPGESVGARFSTASVGARGCWAVVREGRFDLSPCAGALVHLLSARGYGADANYDVTAQSAVVAGGVLGRFTLTPWLAARARVDALVPLARPAFVVERIGDVHAVPALGASASLGVEMLFL